MGAIFTASYFCSTPISSYSDIAYTTGTGEASENSLFPDDSDSSESYSNEDVSPYTLLHIADSWFYVTYYHDGHADRRYSSRYSWRQWQRFITYFNITQKNSLPVPLQILPKFIIVWQFCFKVSDAAIGLLMIFFQKFLKMLELMGILGSKSEECLSDACPSNYKALLQRLDLEGKNYIEYVVCPKCNAMYDYDDCKQVINGKECSRVCRYIQFPNHTMRTFRTECGTQLLVQYNNKNGKHHWHPRKWYCYRSLKESLTTLINRPDFLEKCELWRSRVSTRNSDSELLCDIYDGRVWREFQTVDGRPFLCESNNFAFSLGCDWFKPFKHLNDSIGALYMVILNLPWEEW